MKSNSNSSSYLDPDLVYEKCVEGAPGFAESLDYFPTGYNQRTIQPQLSGKPSHYFGTGLAANLLHCKLVTSILTNNI